MEKIYAASRMWCAKRCYENFCDKAAEFNTSSMPNVMGRRSVSSALRDCFKETGYALPFWTIKSMDQVKSPRAPAVTRVSWREFSDVSQHCARCEQSYGLSGF